MKRFRNLLYAGVTLGVLFAAPAAGQVKLANGTSLYDEQLYTRID